MEETVLNELEFVVWTKLLVDTKTEELVNALETLVEDTTVLEVGDVDETVLL